MADHDYCAHPLAESLVVWFTQNGGHLNSDVQVVYSDSHGFHMRAARPLSSVIVATCPLKLTLSILNLDSDQKEVLSIESPLQQCRGRIPDQILTYLLLIEQHRKGQQSPWHAYIACLPGPESMTTPLWFDDDDMVFLAGTSLAPAAKERKTVLHGQWEHALTVMKELKIALADEIDLESLLWAATIFTSRAFISTHILPGRVTIPILFPVVDILNHSVSAKVEWDFQSHQSFTLKCLEYESFQPGQELFNNYAPKQNDELLLGYGFCLEDNPIEQFALKLAFQPQLQQYAEQLGLLSAENVPFGMSTGFLKTDPCKEQHFLRGREHPFGRYENYIPFFRGVPPYIVHFFFIQSVITLDLDVSTIDVARPGPRITLQILVLLHQALTQRCSMLPVQMTQQPKNEKQKYAKAYRDGQAKIIQAVRRELQAAITKLRTPNVNSPHRSLYSVADVLVILEADLPKQAQKFVTGLQQHGLQGPENESLLWTLLLTVLVSTTVATGSESGHPIFAVTRALCARHPLPALEDGIEDAETYTFVDEHLGDFLHLAPSDPDATPTDVLDDLGVTFVNQPADSDASGFIKSRTENLGARIIMWAMKVVEQDVVPVLEEGSMFKGLYITPEKAEGEATGENWMYEDVAV